MKKVILISGKMRSGKNQFAEYLRDYLQNFGIVKTDLFAKGVKDGAKEDFKELQTYLNNFVDSLLSDEYDIGDVKLIEKLKTLKISDDNWYEDKTEITRRLLQIYGTEIFRNRVDDDYWIKEVNYRLVNTNADYILLTDVRFINEIERLDNTYYESITIRINRNNDLNNSVNEHPSEKELDFYDKFNYTIDNNGSLDDLRLQAIRIADEIIGG